MLKTLYAISRTFEDFKPESSACVITGHPGHLAWQVHTRLHDAAITGGDVATVERSRSASGTYRVVAHYRPNAMGLVREVHDFGPAPEPDPTDAAVAALNRDLSAERARITGGLP